MHNQAESLANVDDVMKELTGKFGEANAHRAYLAKKKTGWVAVPTSSGTQTKPPCVRISWFKKHGLTCRRCIR